MILSNSAEIGLSVADLCEITLPMFIEIIDLRNDMYSKKSDGRGTKEANQADMDIY